MKHLSPFERAIEYHFGTVMITIARTLILICMPLFVSFGLYHYIPDLDLVIAFCLSMIFFGFGFVFPYYIFISAWAWGKRRRSTVLEDFIGRCFCPFLLLLYYPRAKARLLRHYLIGHQMFFHDPQRFMLSEIERVQSQADLKIRLIENNQKHDTAKERKRLEKLLTWAQRRKEKFYIEQFVAVARAISQYVNNIENHSHFDEENLTDLFHRYQHAFEFHKEIIEDRYAHRMSPNIYEPNLPDISPKQTTMEGKLLYLAVLIRSHRDNHFDRLDFEKSDFTLGRYVYSQSRSAIDIAHWQKFLPAINAYLGGEWMVEPLDGTSLVLSKLKELPAVIPFEEAFLKMGEIFYGFNVRTGERYYNSLENIPHHLVVGQSGSGKSVFLNQVMASILYNIDAFEKVYLVDLKGGVELSKYAPLHETLQLVDDYDDLPGIAAKIYQTLRNRLKEMRDTGETLYTGKHILLVVDEYAQINQFEPITKEEKENHKQLLSYLNRISQLGRATRITIWAQLQKATVDNISASFRNNLQSKICFKVHSNSDAATVFGNTDELPGVASIGGFKNLAKGRFVFSDDIRGEGVYMQAAMMGDEVSLARLV